MRRFFAGCAILALGLVLSACELRAEISVNDDGSGTMGVTFLIEPEYIDLMNQSGAGVDPFAEMKADLANDPVAWKVKDVTQGRLRGIHATFPFTSVEELLKKAQELNQDSSDSPTGIEGFTLKREGGGWRFEGTSTDVTEQTDDFPIPAEQLATLVRIQFRVALPGTAAEHNADETTSSAGKTTFIWKPSIEQRSVSFRARTTAGSSGIPVLPIGLGAAVIGGASVVAILRTRRPSMAGEGIAPTIDVESSAAPPAPDEQNSL